MQGDLDRILIRPRTVMLQVAAHDFEARKLARILQGLTALGLACAALGLGPASLAWLALGVAGGVLAFAGIIMFGAAVQFWTLGQTSELQNILTYGGSATLTYPVSVYTTWFRRAITYGVPLAFGAGVNTSVFTLPTGITPVVPRLPSVSTVGPTDSVPLVGSELIRTNWNVFGGVSFASLNVKSDWAKVTV